MSAPTGTARTALWSGVALALGAAAAISAAAAPGAYTRPGRTEVVATVPPPGCLGVPSDVSDDGRYVVYTAGRTAQTCQVYRLDRRSGKVALVSATPDGSPAVGLDPNSQNARGGAQDGSVSADGRFVAFSSAASNLVPGDTNNASDIFVRDMILERTTRVSVATGGAQASRPAPGAPSSYGPSISDDGHFVVFQSTATNLVPGDTNGANDAFWHDMRLGKTVRVNVSATGAQDNGRAWTASLSGNGRYVAFSSDGTHLVPGETVHETCNCDPEQVYVRDIQASTTVRVSVPSDGSEPGFAGVPSCVIGTPAPVTVPGELDAVNSLLSSQVQACGSEADSTHAISDDGRYVVFNSNATNLVPNPSPASIFRRDLFVHDRVTHRTERVSVDSYGQPRTDRYFHQGSVSGDGRYVAFSGLRGTQTGPVNSFGSTGHGEPGAGNEVYGHDRLTGTWDWLSVATSGKAATAPSALSWCRGQGNGGADSWVGDVSRDGRFVVFQSNATDLTAGKPADACGMYLRDRGPSLGVGALVDSGIGSSEPADPLCVAEGICVPSLPGGTAVAGTADLTRANIVSRTTQQDLFVRLDVQRMGTVAGHPEGGVLYGVSFTASGSRFELRVQRAPGPDYDTAGGASFGLFRATAAGVWARVATLKGGYGTIGDSVVTAVPLSALGGQARLTDVTAYTAVGSYLNGATRVLDSLRLTR